MLEPHCQPYFMLQKIPINNITVQVIITWLGVLLYYDCNNTSSTNTWDLQKP